MSQAFPAADAPGETDAIEKKSMVRRRVTPTNQPATMVAMEAEAAAVMIHPMTLMETTSRLMPTC